MSKLGIKFIVLIVCLGFVIPSSAQLNKKAAKSLIKRVIPQKANYFEVEYISAADGKDVFELESEDGKIVLRGNNGVSVASALKYYLYHFCHCSITWNGTNLKLPDTLPQVKKEVRKVTPYKYRYYLNYCTFNYTMSWWDWKRWQEEIDWMALNGINMPLALTGEAAIWQKVYEKLGFTKKELKNFFSGPAYFAWFWMGNLDGWGGPLPQHWIDTHKELQKKILEYERSLGMTPVLPAFTGHVPPDFKKKFPQAKLKKTKWTAANFDSVYILDPADPLFDRIGRMFIEEQTRIYGTDHLYSADTFNENLPPSNDSTFLDSMSRRVFQSMQIADPQAIWVMQGWMFSYQSEFWQPKQVQALLNAVPDDHMIILDLWSEAKPVWNRTDAYYGKPWIWNMLHNFGGDVSLYGRMREIAHTPSSLLGDPAAGKYMGIGLTPEAIEQNPVMYQLMLDNVWRSAPIDVNRWLKGYVLRRYGEKNSYMNVAWEILANSVYNGPASRFRGPESIITGRPTFSKYARYTNTKLTYDPMELVIAWDMFMKAAFELKGSDGFQYDIVDITRQVLANYALPLQQQFVAAYKAHDKSAFDKYAREFLQLIDDMNTLLRTRKDFLLGPWIMNARKWGKTEKEKNLYEFNAKDLITLWGNKDCQLHEYANKQWAGLLKHFYKVRWEKFFAYVDSCMSKDSVVDVEAFDNRIKDWEWQWVNGHERYPLKPQGHPIAIAEKMYYKYRSKIEETYQ